MKVLIACEFSGIVRDAFIARGHDAMSCDLLPSERPGPHYQGFLEEYFNPAAQDWDLVIAHPPCTHLASSGARWFKEKRESGEQDDAINFFYWIIENCSKYSKLCIENPIGIMSTKYRKPDQIIQPWMFGHGETKATCLWLYGLPPLEPTNIVPGRGNKIHKMPGGNNQAKNRSRTFQGIADAMAEQWGGLT